MLSNVLALALREIRRNTLRSVLTTLGIVIGVAAVITMVTLGGGAAAQVKEQISSLGSNLINIRPGQRAGSGGSSSEAPRFDSHTVEAIEQEVLSLEGVAPTASKGAAVIYGSENWSTTITGTNNDYFDVRDWAIGSGRTFTDNEIRSGKALCILGATVRKALFGNADPLGERIRIEKIPCEVVGTLESKGQVAFGGDQDDIVLMPIKTAQRRIVGNQDIGVIQVSVKDGHSLADVKRQLGELLRELRNISPGDKDDFSVQDMTEVASTLEGTTKVLTALLGSVAAVSLLVGGIGIMNIMLVSVTERTREIGIRLAIGALERDVLTQFLTEAVVLSSFGGLLGIVIALATSIGLAGALQIPFVLDIEIILIAFAFSAAVGVLFGYFPAQKAARLDPIDALRHE